MGLDYALVHVYYTIPPAILLTLLYRPLFTSLDLYRLVFIITIAVVATIPWDSYLIRHKVWSYPPDAVLGPTLLDIPLEELFFFVIQTYNTSFLYFILSIPTFHPVYLCGPAEDRRLRPLRWIVSAGIVAAIACSNQYAKLDGRGFYMSLILTWAGPFVLFLWILAYQFLIKLPLSNTLWPICLPTLYLWAVDTLALQRGTWVIETGTKLGWELWHGLDIEEAVFFVMTNILIVFGLVAFDNAVAVLRTMPSQFPLVRSLPSPVTMIWALLLSTESYDVKRITALREAHTRLRRKSRSFYLASGAFPRSLRQDLILLYSFCRAADDLVDEAQDMAEANKWIQKLWGFLDARYASDKTESGMLASDHGFPLDTQLALDFLPTAILPPKPLYELLDGFKMDLAFSNETRNFPITDDTALKRYGNLVASTVAELCIELIYHHLDPNTNLQVRSKVLNAGRLMGTALQYVNIARDIHVDAALGRVYIPSDWLKEAGISSAEVLKNPDLPQIDALRQRLLDLAFIYYDEARPLIELLPIEARGPIRVTVESYMEIGRTLRQPGYRVKNGKATVNVLRRVVVAWNALNG